MSVQKPFLKWVGGKTQLMNTLIELIPSKMDNYYEPFVGGGSVLFAILSLQKNNKITITEKIYANDVNEGLINTYKQIQTNAVKVYENLESSRNIYHSLDGTVINRSPNTVQESLTSKESYYYWIRKQFNETSKDSIESAAFFIFLNKTGFRGMYREGPRGFNVPYGHYKKTPTMVTQAELLYVQSLISNVVFSCTDFMNVMTNIGTDDFMYLDPPYAPENAKSFVGYTSSGFDLEQHNVLFKRIRELSNSGVRFVMSNAKVDLVTNNFTGFEHIDIQAKRAINSKNPEATTTEVIVFKM